MLGNVSEGLPKITRRFFFLEEGVLKLNCDGRNELGAALDAVESKLLF